MADVYRNGTQNIVYLGEEDVSEGIESIKAIIKDAESTPESFAKAYEYAGNPEESETNLKAEYDGDQLFRIYELSWFRYAFHTYGSFCSLLYLLPYCWSEANVHHLKGP